VLRVAYSTLLLQWHFLFDHALAEFRSQQRGAVANWCGELVTHLCGYCAGRICL